MASTSGEIAAIMAAARRYVASVEENAKAAMEEVTELLAEHAVADHSYTNRTGDLSASIRGFVEQATPQLIVGVLTASMDYAAFVELCHDGRYAFLMPVVTELQDEIVAILVKHLTQ